MRCTSRLRLRALAAALVASLAAVVLPAVAQPALAASVPAASGGARIYAELADPLMTDPVQVLVAVADAEGRATAFRGTVTLAVGRTRVYAPVVADGTGSGTTTLTTAALSGGDATLTVVTRPGGTLVVPRFTTIDPPWALAGFGCAAVTRSTGTLTWAVTALHGLPVRTPNGRGGVLLPYVASVARLSQITGDDGRPTVTRGTVLVTDGRGRRVGVVALRPSVRTLVFGVPLPASLRSALRPGAYTATLLLTDAAGRGSSAVQGITVQAKARPDCR